MKKAWVSQLLRWLGHRVPNIPYVRAVANLVLRPLHTAMGLGGGVVNVLGFAMRLDPNECVDSNLWFTPHLYDRDEIAFLSRHFPGQGVFVDVGANIGFWSLRFSHAFPQAKILAIEANPTTFNALCENITRNAFRNVHAVNVGVSDEVGSLPLYCNDTGNRGGDSFAFSMAGRARSIMVSVKPLEAILKDAGLEAVDVIKMDIEGLEEKVLARFFSDAPRSLWPQFICIEVLHAPQAGALLRSVGYGLALEARDNSIFTLERRL